MWLKRKDLHLSIWKKNAFLYQWGILFNIVIGTVTYVRHNLQDHGSVFDAAHEPGIHEVKSWFHGFNGWVFVWIPSVCTMGFLISFMFKYLGNLFKCISKMMVVFLVSMLSMHLFGTPISNGFWVGFVFYVVGLYLWGMHQAFVG